MLRVAYECECLPPPSSFFFFVYTNARSLYGVQSGNRYKSSAIALAVADRYQKLDLPVGVLVIDYENQKIDGDFKPCPLCFPSLSTLSSGIRTKLNATTVLSFWPEAKNSSANFPMLEESGCLINADLGGYAFDTTVDACRTLIWDKFLKPNYYEQGVSAYWLDETDGEGTGIANGNYGYDTSWGPASAYNNLWVGSYLAAFSEPIKRQGREPPLVLTRGVWAGGQKHGIVLWSSDIWSSFEELASQVPEGVHAGLSGIPWWTTDVGGYGCGNVQPNYTPYMQELMVRWYVTNPCDQSFPPHSSTLRFSLLINSMMQIGRKCPIRVPSGVGSKAAVPNLCYQNCALHR